MRLLKKSRRVTLVTNLTTKCRNREEIIFVIWLQLRGFKFFTSFVYFVFLCDLRGCN